MFRQRLSCARMRALILLGIMVTAAACGAPTAPPVAADPSSELILIVNVDTLRRDRLGLYGDTRGLTPHLDRLARDRGVVFDTAYAASNHTYPSVGSLMTGRYPTSHGLWDHGMVTGLIEPNIATILPQRFVALERFS